MTWWSLRRRLGVTQDVEDEDQPPAAATATGHPLADWPDQYHAGPPAGAPEPGWFRAGREQPGYPGPGQPETAATGRGPGGAPAPAAGPGSGLGLGPSGPALAEGGRYGAGQFGGTRYAGGPYPGGQPGGLPLPPQAQPAVTRAPSAGSAPAAAVPPHRAAPNLAPPAGLTLPQYPVASSPHPVAAPLAAEPPPHLFPPRRPSPAGSEPAVRAQASVHHPETAPAATWAVRPDPGQLPAGEPWPDICDQFGLHLLVLAEQLRTSLDELEADEADPERLRRLYKVDHAVTRMRRACRDLRTLAGRSEEELAGFTTSLLDVIRMAASAIERYAQVSIGRVTDLAVLGYAADDIASLMAALLDNATRYSPGMVTVSGHLLEDGGVMFRVEDVGIGIGADRVEALNALFAGPVAEVDERTGKHTGFPVVHRIARKHEIGVRLTGRPQPGNGTVAMVTLPPHLLCEVPADDARPRTTPGPVPAQPAPVEDLSQGEPTRPQRSRSWAPPTGQAAGGQAPGAQARGAQARGAQAPGGHGPGPSGVLPRRERASLRGTAPRGAPARPHSARPPATSSPATQPPAAPRPPATQRQQSAARRAFADELAAFSQGASGGGEPSPNPAAPGLVAAPGPGTASGPAAAVNRAEPDASTPATPAQGAGAFVAGADGVEAPGAAAGDGGPAGPAAGPAAQQAAGPDAVTPGPGDDVRRGAGGPADDTATEEDARP